MIGICVVVVVTPQTAIAKMMIYVMLKNVRNQKKIRYVKNVRFTPV